MAQTAFTEHQAYRALGILHQLWADQNGQQVQNLRVRTGGKRTEIIRDGKLTV